MFYAGFLGSLNGSVMNQLRIDMEGESVKGGAVVGVDFRVTCGSFLLMHSEEMS